ncbi:MAG: LptF/LptG family permease [Deltaproteobacteria bacterium]|nr:LptF/LptG family permease [Deltaproteobacteria bacterium]MBW2665433.1 LptF/LptG family permease [Deltaproteobacteria bacterium]
MLRPSHVSRYVATEVVLYTVLAALAAVPVILIPNVLELVDDFAVVGVTATDLISVFGWVLLLVVSFALPIAFVIGLLLAMGRLHGDGEILALQACGMSVFALVRPVIAVGVLFSLLSAVVSIGFEHRAWKQIEVLRRQVLSRGAVIEPGHFQRFGDRTVLTQSHLGDGFFGGIMIFDDTSESNSLLIFAESAEYSFDPDSGMLRLTLADGDLRMEAYPNEEIDEHRISFEEFEYAFPAPRLVGEQWRFRPNELSAAELLSVVEAKGSSDLKLQLRYRKARHYESHFQRLFAVPLTPFVFSIIGVPLAVFGFVGSRARGLFAALLLLGGYYALFIFCYDAARSGHFSPVPAIWFPNAAVFVAGVVLLLVSARSHR